MLDSKKKENRALNPLFLTLESIDNYINRFEEFMLIFGVLAMAINTIAAVVSRFIFNSAITFTDELNMIFIVIVTFAGLSYAARYARHIRMSAFFDALSYKLKKILMVIISLFSSLFMLFLSIYSYNYIVDVYESGRVLPALGLPIFYIYLWVPFGFLITALQYIFTLIKNLTESEIYLSTNIKDSSCEDVERVL